MLDAMDYMECSAVYIDGRFKSERWVNRGSTDTSAGVAGKSLVSADEPETLEHDLEQLLEICKQVYVCHAGTTFATKLAELTERVGDDCTPVFAFFDIDFSNYDTPSARRRSSQTSVTIIPSRPAAIKRGFTFATESEETYGLQLLSAVSADVQVREAPNLIVPVAILRSSASATTSCMEGSDGAQLPGEQQCRSVLSPEPKSVSRCVDVGALDVLTSPLDQVRVHGLMVHAYRVHRTAQKELSRFLAKRKLRKQSWVGVRDEKPYAYLREAMVSKLMRGICNPEEVIEDFQDLELAVSAERQSFVKGQIGSWNFTAQQFSDDELVLGAFEILRHAFDHLELDYLRLTPGELRTFLLACRAAYNSFVLYHNFRHAVDVLQSLFCFLLHIGALPSYGEISAPSNKSPIASLLSPFETLTLLIAAIGHDVGHPGVNNFFLVKLNAPLAQLYNDNSVLEAFHCAAFSQILRRHWPSAFNDQQLRKLLISSILATDMAVHQKFVERMGSFQEKYHANGDSFDGWKPQDVEQYKTLLCGLLIKCADISNVARPWDVAERWTKILQEEFANQGEMEKEVGMETALFGGPPELGNILKLATSQTGFMSIFALPLFEGVADLLPQMAFTVDQIRSNQTIWRAIIAKKTKKKGLFSDEGAVSPRTRSPTRDAKNAGPSTEGYFDSADISSVEHDDRTSDNDVDHGYYESPHSSIGSVPHDSSSENVMRPGSSTDISGPAIEVNSVLLHSQPPSRKSSTALPCLALLSSAGASADPDVLSRTPQPSGISQARSEEHRASGDSAVLAAVLYANSLPSGAGATASSTGNGRSSGYDEEPHDSHFHKSYNPRGLGSRIASSTSAPYENSRTERSDLPVRSESDRPSSFEIRTSDLRIQHENRYPFDQHNSSHALEGFDKHQIMATIVGNESESPAGSTTTAESIKDDPHHQHRHHGDDFVLGIEHGARKLLKRGSRLRLAFWKRKGHQSQQHLSGEL